MKKISDELRQKMEDGSARFYQEAHILFSDGREKDLEKKDFYISGNSFSDGAGTNALALGESMSKTMTSVLVNDNDQMSERDFNNAKITVWCCCDIQNEKERIKIGTYTINTTSSKEGEIEITGTDDMYKGDVDYNTSLSFPTTTKQILIDSCRKCGVALKRESFTNDDFLVQKKPTQCTHRAVWGMIAMLAGGNARMDEENRLEIVSYDLSFFSRRGLDGGKFDNGEPLYKTGDAADGGNFLDYSSGDTYDGGNFEELSRYHMFYQSQPPTIDTDDILITGVQASSVDSSGFFGSEGYVLSVENQLISGNIQSGVNKIGALIVGMKFRPFQVDHTAYPLAEFGDICYVFDRKGNQYQSVITDIGFNFYGYTTIKCAADSIVRNQSEYKPAAAGIVADVEKQTDEKFDEVSNEFDNVNQNIDNINQDIGEVNENIGGLHISLQKTNEGLQAEVSRALSAEETIGSRITMTENNIELEVKRATDAENYLSGRISITESSIDLEVKRAQGAENTLSSRISMTESSIDMEVRRAQGAETDLYSKISMTESSITAEVSRATQAEGNLSSRINITADQISSKVSRGDVESIIEQNADLIRMKADSIVIDSTYFKVRSDGYATMTGATIGDFTLTSTGALRGNGIEINGAQILADQIFVNTQSEIQIGPNIYVLGQLKADGDVRFPGVFYNSTTADPNMHITSTGYLNTKGGSSRKWKHEIGEIKSEEIHHHRLYKTRTCEFIYNDDYISMQDCRRGKKIPGFVIENLKEDYPIAVDYDENGNLSTWSPSMFIAPFLELHKEHHADIEEIKNILNKIIKKIGGI